MWPLLGCAIASVAIMIERFFVLRRVLRSGVGLVSETRSALQNGRLHAATAMLSARGGPVARILLTAIEYRTLPQAQLESMIEEVAVEETPLLARGVSVLDTIVTIAPLLGLLGTVTGMIKAFQVVAISTGMTAPTAITGGVAEALIATASGLLIAIVTLVGYNYLTGQVKAVVSTMEIAATKIVNTIALAESGFEASMSSKPMQSAPLAAAVRE